MLSWAMGACVVYKEEKHLLFRFFETRHFISSVFRFSILHAIIGWNEF